MPNGGSGRNILLLEYGLQPQQESNSRSEMLYALRIVGCVVISPSSYSGIKSLAISPLEVVQCSCDDCI
jgi:hypothetical protein